MVRWVGVMFVALWAHVTLAAALSPDDTARMRAAEVVILGEIHDNADHHAGQGARMEEIGPKAVVFEMLTPEMAARVNEWDGRDLEALGAEIGWEERGWPPIFIYAPVFEAIGEAAVIGAAAPREDVRRAFSEGAAAVFGPGAVRFGLNDDLPAAQQEARAEMQFAAHCKAMPMVMMGGMVEAQRLRDAQFADAALRALESYGAPVVVITGNGHARKDWGMPVMLAQAAPEVSVFTVGFVEAPNAPEDARFDVTVVTEPAPRGDPCTPFSQ